MHHMLSKVITPTEGIVKTMYASKLRTASRQLLTVLLIGGTAGTLTSQLLTAGETGARQQKTESAAKQPETPKEDRQQVQGKGTRQQAARNLYVLMEALHQYHFDPRHGHLPLAIVMGKDGKGGVPHSWRVEILPYLGEKALYDQYHFDEPWDSKDNRALIARMPPVFRSPRDTPVSTHASYFALVTPGLQPSAPGSTQGGQGGDAAPPNYHDGTVFSNQAGTRLTEIPDGISNVVALVEAKREVPWTKPEDIPYYADKPLPKLGEWFAQGWHAGFADGEVKMLALDNDETTIRRLFTIGDGHPTEPKFVGLPAGEPDVEAGGPMPPSKPGDPPAEPRPQGKQPGAEPTAAMELEKFQGTWTLVSSESNGQAKTEDKNPYAMTVTGTKWKIHRGEEVAVEGIIKLIDVTTPARKFDLLKPIRLGPVPTVDYGIYEWKDETLRYCVRNGPLDARIDNAADFRPREFATRDCDGRTMYVWKRVQRPHTGATLEHEKIEGRRVLRGPDRGETNPDARILPTNVAPTSNDPIPLPKLDENSARGLEFECRPTKSKFVVGEPVNILCTVKNTTGSLKPIGWHPSAGAHYSYVPAAKAAWEGGVLPIAIPRLCKQIMTKSKESQPGQILFLSAHDSIQILLTHKGERPTTFKGRVVYDPIANRNGWVSTNRGDAPPWTNALVSSNEFEFEISPGS
jgi:uncharacterized protein (TIGR03067 family)